MGGKRSLDTTLAAKVRLRDDVRRQISRLYAEEAKLTNEIRDLEGRARVGEHIDWAVVQVGHHGEDVLPRPGTALRAAADVLLEAGEPLHVDEIRRRILAVEVKVSKPSLTASLDKRARQGWGFHRVADRPNTFYFVPERKKEANET